MFLLFVFIAIAPRGQQCRACCAHNCANDKIQRIPVPVIIVCYLWRKSCDKGKQSSVEGIWEEKKKKNKRWFERDQHVHTQNKIVKFSTICLLLCVWTFILHIWFICLYICFGIKRINPFLISIFQRDGLYYSLFLKICYSKVMLVVLTESYGSVDVLAYNWNCKSSSFAPHVSFEAQQIAQLCFYICFETYLK